MIKAIIIAGICFTAGNVVWEFFDEPKIFFVPLAVYLLLMAYNCVRPVTKITKAQEYYLTYFILLAAGNVIKQFFYTPTIKQINDYWFGGLLTIGLIIILWAYNRKQNTSSGRG